MTVYWNRHKDETERSAFLFLINWIYYQKISTKKTPELNSFTDVFDQTFKEEILPILHKDFQKTK
jgi:hypothetical protein